MSTHSLLQGGPYITSIVRERDNQASNQPQLSHNGGMKGSLQCMIINTHGGIYNNALNAVPMEEALENSTNEATPGMPDAKRDTKEIKCYIMKDVNKELSFELYDVPNAQKSRNHYLECIEVLFKECSKSGGS